MNRYKEMRELIQREVNAFPLFAAFTREQFDEGYKELGLKDSDRVTHIGGGAYVPSAKMGDFHALFARHDAALAEALKDEAFAYDAFVYELQNHEYGYTWDEEPALDALGLSCADVEGDPVLLSAFVKARDYVRSRE